MRILQYAAPFLSETVIYSGNLSKRATGNAFYFYGHLVPKNKASHPKGKRLAKYPMCASDQGRNVRSLRPQTQHEDSLLNLNWGAEDGLSEKSYFRTSTCICTVIQLAYTVSVVFMFQTKHLYNCIPYLLLYTLISAFVGKSLVSFPEASTVL